VLLRVAPGIIDNPSGKKIKDEKGEILGTKDEQNIDELSDGLQRTALNLDGKEANNSNETSFSALAQHAKELKTETYAIYLAYKHPEWPGMQKYWRLVF